MALVLASRVQPGFIDIKSHLKLSMEDAMEACGPVFAMLPNLAVGVAGLQAGDVCCKT